MFEIGYSLPIIVVLFLITAFALSRLLFRPMQAILDERERLTTGMLADSEKNLEHYSRMLGEYKNRVKQAQMEGYSLQDSARAENARYRSQRLAEAHTKSEAVIQRMKDDLRRQVAESQERLKADSADLAAGIAALILQKNA